MGVSIKSMHFEDGQFIPAEFSCEGGDNIPTLKVSGISTEAQSIALIVDDPDAPMDEPFVHWVIWHNSPEKDSITISGENIFKFKEGVNTAGGIGWMGPCPPVRHGIHRYYFKIYEIDKPINLSPGITKQDLLDEIQDNIISSDQIVGVYER